MPATGSFYRPQTLKQAKKAYRKSGSAPKLSVSELAIIERRAMLQERADRIKQREARRKANIKKKEEKKEKEKATMIRMGRSVPVEGGIKVGPSQLDLARYMPVVGKTDEEEKKTLRGNVTQSTDQMWEMKLEKAMIRDTGATSMPPPPRSALEPAAANMSKNSTKYHADMLVAPVLDEDYDGLFVSNTQIERELSLSPKNWPAVPTESRGPRIPQAQMPFVDYANGFLAQISTQDLNFTGVFTQIQPRLKPQPTMALSSVTAAEKNKDSRTQAHSGWKAGHMLADISAEDLRFDNGASNDEEYQLWAEISTQDLDFEDMSQPLRQLGPSSPQSSDFDQGFTDNDLVNLATAVELASSNSSHSDIITAPIKLPPPAPFKPTCVS
ncbi:MAG: hypothetical protein Q9163_003924 [Psora crenata]